MTAEAERARLEGAVVEAAKNLVRFADQNARGELGSILVLGAWGLLKDAVAALERHVRG